MPKRTRTSVLIVDVEPARLSSIEQMATKVGLAVSTAVSFEAARRQMRHWRPDVVVAALRLGAYNGLHLAAVTPHEVQRSAAFVFSDHDEPGVAAEAEGLGARLVTGTAVCDAEFWRALASMPDMTGEAGDAPDTFDSR